MPDNMPWNKADLPWQSAALPWKDPNLSWNTAFIPPTLTGGTGTKTGQTTADLVVVTNISGGTMYYVVSTDATQPNQTQMQAGQDSTGSSAAFAANQAVTAAGTQPTVGATGLTAATTYYPFFLQVFGNKSSLVIAASSSFTTDP